MGRSIRRLCAALALALAGPLAATDPAPPAAATAPAEARPARIPALALAKFAGLSDLDLSPDGKHIALRASESGKVQFVVVDAVTMNTTLRFQVPPKTRLEWFRWAGNGKVLLSFSVVIPWFGDEARATRVYYIDLATSAATMLSRSDMGLDGDDLVYTDPDGGYVLLSMQRTIYDYPSVWRFPLDPQAAKLAKEVQAQRPEVWSWFADNAGVVRGGFQSTPSRAVKIWYRKTAADPLRMIGRLSEDSSNEQVFDVLRIFSGSDEGYVLMKDDSAHYVLRKFDYATRTAGEVVYAVPGWDVANAYIDDHNAVVSATYTDDRYHEVWFDPKMKALQARLDKALEGLGVRVVSRARDDSRMLVWAGHEDTPATWYVYTAAGRSLSPLFNVMPDLDPTGLAKPRPISFTARDKTELHGYLTLPRGREPRRLPLVILPHGGPYGVRDELEFDSEVQLLANRGYAVLQPNYRGSDGYGDAFDELGRGQIGRAMQDDLDDAMDWAVAQGIADPARVCMVGSSYGGYAALWAVIRNPDRYRCAASFAGVTDWNRQLKYDDAFFTQKGAKKWRARVKGADNFNLDQVSPALQAARLTRPVLLTHGDADTNVPFKQFKAMQAATAGSGLVETLVFAGEDHGFDQPENRARWYDALDAFLARHNPAD